MTPQYELGKNEKMDEVYLLSRMNWKEIHANLRRHGMYIPSSSRLAFLDPDRTDEEVIRDFVEEQSIPPSRQMPIEFLTRKGPEYRSPEWMHVNRRPKGVERFSLKDFSIYATTGGFNDLYSDASISGGSNLNAGSTNTGAASYTAVGDSDGTSVFTPSDGSNPVTQGVTVGSFVSIYVTSGATVATYISRVTAVTNATNGTVTTSTTAKSGTIPASSGGAHTITLKLGGTWKGPNGSQSFPFGFITNALTNTSGNLPYVNLKVNSGAGGDRYLPTAAITHANANTFFGGYTTTPRDGGRAVIDGGGGSFSILTVSGNYCQISDMVIQNTLSTAAANALTMSGSEQIVTNVWCNTIGQVGFVFTGSTTLVTECEASACGTKNNSFGGYYCATTTGGLTFVRCMAHDCTGTTVNGWDIPNSQCVLFIECVAFGNGKHGYSCAINAAIISWKNSDGYNNGVSTTGDNWNITPGGSNSITIYLENCNSALATGADYNITNGFVNGLIFNCSYPLSGTTSSGTIGITITPVTATVRVVGTITLAANTTAWNAPATGDFRITNALCKGTGRGTFTELGNSRTGTVGYPDVGAATHQSAANSPLISTPIVPATWTYADGA